MWDYCINSSRSGCFYLGSRVTQVRGVIPLMQSKDLGRSSLECPTSHPLVRLRSVGILGTLSTDVASSRVGLQPLNFTVDTYMSIQIIGSVHGFQRITARFLAAFLCDFVHWICSPYLILRLISITFFLTCQAYQTVEGDFSIVVQKQCRLEIPLVLRMSFHRACLPNT